MVDLDHDTILDDWAEPVTIDGTQVQAIFAEPSAHVGVGVIGQMGSGPQVMLPAADLPARFNPMQRDVVARGRAFVCREERPSATTGWVTLELTAEAA
jgi:hypothetical protein